MKKSNSIVVTLICLLIIAVVIVSLILFLIQALHSEVPDLQDQFQRNLQENREKEFRVEDVSLQYAILCFLIGAASIAAGILLFNKPNEKKEPTFGESLFSIVLYTLPWWGRKALFIAIGLCWIYGGIVLL